MAESTAAQKAAKKPSTPMSRKTLRKIGRQKRTEKILNDKEFAKALFAGKSKRSNEKKAAFRKAKSGKK